MATVPLAAVTQALCHGSILPRSNLDSIVNGRYLDCLEGVLQLTSGVVDSRAEKDKENLRIAPAINDRVSIDDSFLGFQLFGPSLPTILPSRATILVIPSCSSAVGGPPWVHNRV